MMMKSKSAIVKTYVLSMHKEERWGKGIQDTHIGH